MSDTCRHLQKLHDIFSGHNLGSFSFEKQLLSDNQLLDFVFRGSHIIILKTKGHASVRHCVKSQEAKTEKFFLLHRNIIADQTVIWTDSGHPI